MKPKLLLTASATLAGLHVRMSALQNASLKFNPASDNLYYSLTKHDMCHATGTHAEGGIWATLFGLLMWDIIFTDVPDVFQTAFQTAPLDLGTVVFYPSRKDAIESRLSKVREGQGPLLLQSCWQEHHGQWCRGVNWDRHGMLQSRNFCLPVLSLGPSTVIHRYIADKCYGCCSCLLSVCPAKGERWRLTT